MTVLEVISPDELKDLLGIVDTDTDLDLDLDTELDLDLRVTVTDAPAPTIYASGTCGGCPKPSQPGYTCQFTCQNTCGGTCGGSCGGTCDYSVCSCPSDDCSGFFCF
jgi:hypothetical protein